MSAEADLERKRARQRAITEAEVQDIVRALMPYGVLGHDALAAQAGATRWEEGAFDHALQAAVRAGAVEKLPGGFYKVIR